MKNIILLSLLLSLLSCQDGPKAAFNENFEDRGYSGLPFEKIIGFYKLDNDSKKRYKIPKEIDLTLEIQPDKKLIANNYVDAKTWLISNKKLESTLFYANDDKRIYMSCYKLNKGGGIELYYRKKDSVITLYVYTPPLKGQEHGDYLRYIKVK
ncbi:hypothetical protein [Cloacibacterium sp. TD35]|uniref:hypothetical protein n=1 Tax=Cloacibacterium sp. TD35 TaxID=2976818 RepID=UPI00237ED8B8|nr:hypothetical protein [Cloacibacterium sp. TD35]WDT67294.1 hypothetical protein N7277_08100 [Cloacibacterium sp. TD35]